MRVRKLRPTHLPHLISSQFNLSIALSPSYSPPFVWLVSKNEKQRGKNGVFVDSEEGKDSFLVQWFLTMPGECCIFSWEEHLPFFSRAFVPLGALLSCFRNGLETFFCWVMMKKRTGVFCLPARSDTLILLHTHYRGAQKYSNILTWGRWF